jgi:choline kinase
VVVVGHMADRARALISVPGVEIEFVENADYATTNTMYSTLLAVDALAQGGYLVEGDIAASDGAMNRLTTARGWAADPWTPAHSGSRLRTQGKRIVGQEIWRQATVGDTANLWKSAGMLSLGPDDAAVLSRCLRDEAAAGRTNLYYDDVVGRHIGEFRLDVIDLSGAPWVEIDDLDDLAAARREFEKEQAP